MSRIAYVNGQYRRHANAYVHIEDRGYQFSDGVYEVTAVVGGRLIDEELHYDRLERSLAGLRIAMPMGRAALRMISRELLRRNLIRDGILYIQVTRGVARRDHPFPNPACRPAVVMTCKAINFAKIAAMAERGIKVVTHPDQRWQRRDIKSISLLPNVLAKQAAREAGAFEAWLVRDDGTITEGSSTNAWIVTRDEIVTHGLGHAILGGITRHVLAELAQKNGLRFVERAFSLDEAKTAREAFITSTTSFVLPVVEIDGQAIGAGKPGPVTQSLRAAYLSHVFSQA